MAYVLLLPPLAHLRISRFNSTKGAVAEGDDDDDYDQERAEGSTKKKTTKRRVCSALALHSIAPLVICSAHYCLYCRSSFG